MIGQTLNHYQILEQLGKGGMGEVYVAEDTKLQRNVALKTLPPEMSQEPDRVKRFEREVKTLAALNHPNIVTIYSVEKTEDVHFFTMELVQGQNLAQLIPRAGFSLQSLFELMIPLTDAISVAHEQGITHRDLKPENIIVSEEGRLKVLDFGLAKYWEVVPDDEEETKLPPESLTQEGRIIGTVSYMSPEQALGKIIDQRSDIFSLGILFYEMATGHRPFEGETNMAILTSIIKDMPRPVTDLNPTLPQEIARITKRCLIKEPGQRYQSSSDLLVDLKSLKEDFDSGDLQPAQSGQTSVVSSERTHFFTQPKLWVGIVFIIGMGLLLGWFFTQQDSGPGPITTTGKPTIAVMDFEDHTGSSELDWLSSGLPSMLMTGLAQSKGLEVVSSQRILELIKQLGHNIGSQVDKTIMSEVARRAGAVALVGGNIFQVGPEIRIDVQVEDLSSGHLLAAETVRGTNVFELVDVLTNRIRQSFFLPGTKQDRGISEVTTQSLKAYRLFNEGMEAKENYRWSDAFDAFQQAVDIDPTFALAYVQLAGIANEFIKKPDLSAEYKQKLHDHLDRLPEKQQLLVKNYYSPKRTKGIHYTYADPVELQNNISSLKEFIAQYPDTEDAYFNLSQLYMEQLAQPEQALSILEQGISQFPHSGQLLNFYGYYLKRVGRFEEAFDSITAYKAMNPDEPNPYDSLGETYLSLGQPEQALKQYERALTLDPQFFHAYLGKGYASLMMGHFQDWQDSLEMADKILTEQGSGLSFYKVSGNTAILTYYGRIKEALQLKLMSGKKRMPSKRAHDDQVWNALVLSLRELEQGNWQKSLSFAHKAESLFLEKNKTSHKSSIPVLIHYLAGMAELRSGNNPGAHNHLSAMKNLYSPDQPVEKWWYSLLQGEIALAHGDLEQAQSYFEKSRPHVRIHFAPTRQENLFDHNLPFKDGLARVFIARGDLDLAIEQYNKIITPGSDTTWTSILYPGFVIKLARLLVQQGDHDAARREYERFVNLWKGADPNQDQLVEAKKYLSQN